MEGLLSLLLFGAVFFVMMRFGCGAHVMHGKHGHGRNRDAESIDHRDPVCGMAVDAHSGYGMMHDERLYRFCSRECMDRFEADPACYIKQKSLEDKS
jgi:YHS domain-containing protein